MTLALLSNPNDTAAEGIKRQYLHSQTPNDQEPQATMRVQKRNDAFEPVDVRKPLASTCWCTASLNVTIWWNISASF